MKYKILVTGGAGFIGSYLVEKLIQIGHDVVILDNLDPQVHQGMPAYLNKNAKLVIGDVRNLEAVKKAMEDVEIVFHLAASVGVGQSMYQIKKYVDSNSLGTANLLNFLVNEENSVKKLIVASSMSTYGEGLYECKKCGLISPPLRTEKQLEKKSGNFIALCVKGHWNHYQLQNGKNKSQQAYMLLQKKIKRICVCLLEKHTGLKLLP